MAKAKKSTKKAPKTTTKLSVSANNEKVETKGTKTTLEKDASKENHVPWVICETTLPDGTNVAKRFRENKLPSYVVFACTVEGEWVIICWRQDVDGAYDRYSRLMGNYVDEDSKTFKEKRYTDCIMTDEIRQGEKLPWDARPLPSEMTGNRGAVRNSAEYQERLAARKQAREEEKKAKISELLKRGKTVVKEAGK
jgi:hypothetical protein